MKRNNGIILSLFTAAGLAIAPAARAHDGAHGGGQAPAPNLTEQHRGESVAMGKGEVTT